MVKSRAFFYLLCLDGYIWQCLRSFCCQIGYCSAYLSTRSPQIVPIKLTIFVSLKNYTKLSDICNYRSYILQQHELGTGSPLCSADSMLLSRKSHQIIWFIVSLWFRFSTFPVAVFPTNTPCGKKLVVESSYSCPINNFSPPPFSSSLSFHSFFVVSGIWFLLQKNLSWGTLQKKTITLYGIVDFRKIPRT